MQALIGLVLLRHLAHSRIASYVSKSQLFNFTVSFIKLPSLTDHNTPDMLFFSDPKRSICTNLAANSSPRPRMYKPAVGIFVS